MTAVTVRRIDEHHVDGKRLGRHVEHDPASRDYAAEQATGPLKLVTWSRYGGPFTQDVGSCTGEAAAGITNTVPTWAGKTLATQDTALKVYELATTLDAIAGSYPPDDTGSSGLAACKALKQLGYITSYRHAFGIDEALRALQLRPVITGVDWHEGFDRPDASGNVEIAGQIRGGHEFEVFAYNPGTGDPLDGIVGAWNSWGAEWGDGGRFYFTARTWATLLAAQGDVTVPVRAQHHVAAGL